MSISERFPETVLRLACVASSNFRLDFEVILPGVFQKSEANTLVIFALTHNFSVWKAILAYIATQKRQVSWVKSWIAPFSKISQSYTTQPFCEYIALFMWVERAACSETLIRDEGFNRGTCASDGCFTKRVGRSMTEQQNTWCFLNSKVSGRQSRILARLLEFNF